MLAEAVCFCLKEENMEETNRIEFKECLTSDLDLEKEVVAFLNYKEGGVIYFGIDKEGVPVGVEDVDGDILKIKDRIKNNVQPSPMGLFDIVVQYFDSFPCIKIVIASGSEKPYFKKKYGMSERGCFIRKGTAAEPMPQFMIESLFAARTRNSISKMRSPRRDLSFEQLRIYYEEKGMLLNEHFKRTLELLTEDGYYNYVAYLLADENNVSVKVAKYASLDRMELIENKDYGLCSLVKVAKAVQERIIGVENTLMTRITPLERKEMSLWNSTALHEAIINALVHNDYTREIPPKFEIFPDRIEITSAGSLPENLTEEEFFDGISVPRNKELMRVFSDLNLVESLGSGVPRILHCYGKDCFVFKPNFIRVSFPVAQRSDEAGMQLGNVHSRIGDREGNQGSNQDSNQGSNQVKMHLSDIVADALKNRLVVCADSVERLEKMFARYLDELQQDSYYILLLCEETSLSKSQIFTKLGKSPQSKNVKMYIQPLIDRKLLVPTIKDKPTSPYQKYRTTSLGMKFLYYMKQRLGMNN